MDDPYNTSDEELIKMAKRMCRLGYNEEYSTMTVDIHLWEAMTLRLRTLAYLVKEEDSEDWDDCEVLPSNLTLEDVDEKEVFVDQGIPYGITNDQYKDAKAELSKREFYRSVIKY